MTPAKVGDLVTAENVSGLPIGTRVEWTSNYYGRVSASKVAADTWVASNGAVRFNDTDMAGGAPTHVSAMPEPVVTIPAAELARLREIERCSRKFLTVYDDSGIILFDRYTPPLRAALATPRTDPPAAFHGSIPHDTNGDVK